jgi:hypothetical protein
VSALLLAASGSAIRVKSIPVLKVEHRQQQANSPLLDSQNPWPAHAVAVQVTPLRGLLSPIAVRTGLSRASEYVGELKRT